MKPKPSIASSTIALAGALTLSSTAAAEEVTLVLNWVAGGDHAPIYWARDEGRYAEAGIELTIEEGRGSAASVQKVGAGATPLGIADMPTALQGRGAGADVVAVMAIYANSPYGIYWVKSSGIETVQDLAGKSIGNPPFDAARQMWPAIAPAIDLEPDAVEFVNIKPEAKVQSLQAGVIDATTHFYNVHYIYQRIFGDDMGFVALRDVGFNPYGNAIIANGPWLDEHRASAEAFVSVTQQAYAECVAAPDPCVEALANAASQKAEDVRANWDLVVELMDPPEGDSASGLGSFDPARMQQAYDWVEASFEIEGYDVTEAYTNELLDPAVALPE